MMSIQGTLTFIIILNVNGVVATDYDFIVVGGGSAGAVVARRLSENPCVKVALLEAGGYPIFLSDIPAIGPYQLNSPIDWKFKVAPQNNSFLSYVNQQPDYPRGKVLGGSSTINTMIYVRGNHHDYDNWETLGNKGWNYSDVLPFFLKAEGNTVSWTKNDTTYHNTKGPLTVSQAPYHTASRNAFLQSAAYNNYTVRDCNGQFQTGFMPMSLTMRDGSRCSTNKAYLEGAPLNLHIITHAHVIKIIFNEKKRAVGVVFKFLGLEFTFKATKEVILSAGAIGSPQILLQSGVGPVAQLQQFNIPVIADLPGVGENLQDHAGSAAAMWTVNCTDCIFDVSKATSLPSILQWLFVKNGPLTVPFGNEALAYVNTKYANGNGERPDLQMQFYSSSDATFIGTVFGPLKKEVTDRYLKSLGSQKVFGLLSFILQPKSRGYVRLQSSDPLQPPLIDFKYFDKEIDLLTLVEGMKLTYAIGNSPPFKSLGAQFTPMIVPGCEDVPHLSDAYWKCACRHLSIIFFHAAGTCKMGPLTDPYAVVDSKLRVCNVIGLRVIDASVMPEIVSANTNAATIMIAEKGVQDIKEDYSL